MCKFNIILLALFVSNAMAFTANETTCYQQWTSLATTFYNKSQVINSFGTPSIISVLAGKDLHTIGNELVSNMIGCMNATQKNTFRKFAATVNAVLGSNGTTILLDKAKTVIAKSMDPFVQQTKAKLAGSTSNATVLTDQIYGMYNDFLASGSIKTMMCQFKATLSAANWKKIYPALLKLATRYNLYNSTC
uniref:DUF148 domain-containing protein n=1 Tax=Rhabditophanes sp. KR3021 TaxID=114890 RepID=A0AC35TZ23_9BILA